MKIAIDGQTLVSPDADRGIGNYVYSLAEALSHVQGHKFHLLQWGKSPREIVGGESLVQVRLTAPPLDSYPGLDTTFHRRNAAIRSYLRRASVDLLFNPNPMQMGVEPLSRPYPVPLVATLHDLTPLVLPELFLDDPGSEFKGLYEERVDHLKLHADHLIADSEATRQDAIRLLGFSPEDVSTVHCGISPEFGAADKHEAAELLARFRLTPGDYLLSAGGYNPKKNFPALFKAFGLVDSKILSAQSLVIAGPINDDEWKALEHLRMVNCPGLRMHRAGYVSNAKLASLYRCATALVAVSLHEGFGLPVIEAMASGCPVIVANAGALPEVAGGSALLCDPKSPESIAEAINKMIGSAKLRYELRNKGLERAGAFSWRRTANEACAVFEKVLSQSKSAARKSPTLPKLAWVSPFPPEPGGVSAYSAELVRLLRSDFAISLVTSLGESDLPADLANLPRISPESKDSIPEDCLVVANICNNLAQGAAPYRWLSPRNCLTIVHDLNIHGFLLDYLVRKDSRTTADAHDQYRRDLMWSHGLPGFEEARNVLEQGQLPDIPRFPCHRLLTQRSRAVIATSSWAASQLENNANPAPVFVLPLGIEHPIPTDDAIVSGYKEKYAPSGEFLIACAGFLEPSRRIDVVIAALADLVHSGVAARLLLAGKAEPSHREWLERVASAHQVRERVAFLDYLPREQDFLSSLAVADVVVHLRHPTNGESSATVLRALSLGRPVIVSNIDSYRDLPDELCWKVDADKTEQALLAEYIRVLAKRTDIRAEMGKLACEYIARRHAWPAVASRFGEIAHEVVLLQSRKIRFKQVATG